MLRCQTRITVLRSYDMTIDTEIERVYMGQVIVLFNTPEFTGDFNLGDPKDEEFCHLTVLAGMDKAGLMTARVQDPGLDQQHFYDPQ